MPSLKDIKKRINSVRNTQQITKAMKMVSAAKLRKAQERVIANRAYAEKMELVLSNLALRVTDSKHPFLRQGKKERALVVLLTADRGLCGGFSNNIAKATERYIYENPENYEKIDLMIIGRKGNDYLKRRPGLNIIKVYENLTGDITYQTAVLLSQEIIALFAEEDKYDVVQVVYNHFKSVISQVITFSQILPVAPREIEADSPVTDYLYEPSASEILDEILPKNVEVQIFRALLESSAAELGARMSSMDSATKNASEMIGKLTLAYNRARQAAITTELMEIISGAESIK